jgi:hypothetical protein
MSVVDSIASGGWIGFGVVGRDKINRFYKLIN